MRKAVCPPFHWRDKLLARADVRFEEAERARRKSRNRKLVVGFFLFLGVVIALESPITRVRQIVVEGNRGIPSASVVAHSGLSKGMSLWQVNARSVSRDLAHSLVLVESASVHTDWWSGKVLIRVAEKHVVAVYMANGRFYNLLNDGDVYTSTTPTTAVSFPLITASNDHPVLGSTVSPAVSLLCEQIAHLPLLDLQNVSELHVSHDGDADVYFNNGFVAEGPIGHLSVLLPKMRQAIAYFAGKGFSPGFIDMTGGPPYRYSPFGTSRNTQQGG